MIALQGGEETEMKPELTQKAIFAGVLRKIMDEKKLTVTALAGLVQNQIPDRKFNPVNISHYRSGRSLPRPHILAALARALEIDIGELSAATGREVEGAPKRRSTDKKAISPQGILGGGPHFESKETPGDLAGEPGFYVQDLKDGEAWIQINQRLSWDMVIKLLQMLKGEKNP